MNWIKENKFLFGFSLVTVLAALALGFLVLQAKGTYDEAMVNYTGQAEELNRLQRLPIFPNQKNLDALGAQKKEMSEAVGGLTKSLAAVQIPPEETTPYQFQDKLKAAVSGIVTKAASSNTKLPEKFFLGFEKYETAPPDNAFVGQLGRQLKAVEWVINEMVESRVAEIRDLKREELAEEKTGSARGPEPAAGGGGREGRGEGRGDGGRGEGRGEGREGREGRGGRGEGRGERSAGRASVTKRPFTIGFIADQTVFRDVLNKITNSKTQFYIPRLITVKNTAEKGPSRVTAAIPGAAAPGFNADGSPAAPAGPAAAPASQYIVGEERVDVTLVLETVDFVEPESK